MPVSIPWILASPLLDSSFDKWSQIGRVSSTRQFGKFGGGVLK